MTSLDTRPPLQTLTMVSSQRPQKRSSLRLEKGRADVGQGLDESELPLAKRAKRDDGRLASGREVPMRKGSAAGQTVRRRGTQWHEIKLMGMGAD